MRVQHSNLSGFLNIDGMFKQCGGNIHNLLDSGEYHGEFYSQ